MAVASARAQCARAGLRIAWILAEIVIICARAGFRIAWILAEIVIICALKALLAVASARARSARAGFRIAWILAEIVIICALKALLAVASARAQCARAGLHLYKIGGGVFAGANSRRREAVFAAGKKADAAERMTKS